jgi:multidrug efflux pump subunit AcrA (membrane-fusion protein)
VDKGQELFRVARKDDVANIYKPAVVTARIAGYISEILVQVEDEIEADDEAVVIVGAEGYELIATASDKDVFKVDIGQSVTARTASGSNITGILVNRSQEPNYDTGLFSLTFHFAGGQKTHVGEFVIIELPVDRAQGFFVRRDLVVRRYGKYFIWIVKSDQTLEAREVVLGPRYGDLVLIESGLRGGDRYLTRLTGREKEGAKADT